MDAFGIFQGGGLKGYAHVGALQAANKRDIKFRGLAGTSAGAIVAALAAVGYTGAELFTEVDGVQKGLLAFEADEILDAIELASADRFRRTREWIAKARHPGLARVGRLLVARWLAQPLLYLWHERFFRRLRSHHGAMRLDRFIDWLDDALRKKIELPKSVPRVRFRDLQVPLRCVAADLTAEGARIFGGDEDADMAVADAVAASACFPLFFRPIRINGSSYVDGGLISTLPAWVFDEQRAELVEMVPTLGFRFAQIPSLQLPSGRATDASFLAFLARLLRTTLAAARTLEDRRVEDYYAVDLKADVEAMAIHKLVATRAATVAQGRVDADAFLNRELGPRDPAVMRVVLSVVANAIKTDLNVAGLVRAYIVMPLDATADARVFYSANMEHDADSRLVLRRRSNGPARCLDIREPVLLRPARLARAAPSSIERSEHGMRRQSVKSVYAVPIFRDPLEWKKNDADARSEPIAGFCFDCDEDVSGRLLNADIEDRLASYAQLVGEHLRLRPLKPGRTPRDPLDDRSPNWRAVGISRALFASTRIRRVMIADDTVAAVAIRAQSRLDRLGLRDRHPVSSIE